MADLVRLRGAGMAFIPHPRQRISNIYIYLYVSYQSMYTQGCPSVAFSRIDFQKMGITFLWIEQDFSKIKHQFYEFVVWSEYILHCSEFEPKYGTPRVLIILQSFDAWRGCPQVISNGHE